MDAWLPEYHNEICGTSLVVVRNTALVELLSQGKYNENIKIEEISPKEVILSQRVHIRRKRELIYMRRGFQTGKNTNVAMPTIAEKMNWWLEKRVQRRSKRAWAIWGRNYGRFAFWISLADVLLLLNVIKYVTRTISFPKRLIIKFKSKLP
jgi:hypothetical protein